jgi:hypothetical protein
MEVKKLSIPKNKMESVMSAIIKPAVQWHHFQSETQILNVCLVSCAENTNLQFYCESWWVRLLLF